MKKRKYNPKPLWWNVDVYNIATNKGLTEREQQIISNVVLVENAKYHEEWKIDLPVVKEVYAYRVSLITKIRKAIEAFTAVGNMDMVNTLEKELKSLRSQPVTFNEVVSNARTSMFHKIENELGTSLAKKIINSMVEEFKYRTGNKFQ